MLNQHWNKGWVQFYHKHFSNSSGTTKSKTQCSKFEKTLQNAVCPYIIVSLLLGLSIHTMKNPYISTTYPFYHDTTFGICQILISQSFGHFQGRVFDSNWYSICQTLSLNFWNGGWSVIFLKSNSRKVKKPRSPDMVVGFDLNLE